MQEAQHETQWLVFIPRAQPSLDALYPFEEEAYHGFHGLLG